MTQVFNGRRTWLTGAGLVAGGVLAGAVLAGTMSANAATTTPTAPATGTTTASSSVTPGGPGVQENDGIPEAQEHHGGMLDHSGTVTAVGSTSVSIKTSTGTTTYTVTSSSDIDKNGEAQLSDLVVGDTVRFSVTSGTTTIDKLHAGDETKDMPAAPGSIPTAAPSSTA